MAFEFLDEFDVLSKWPSDQKALLESNKWNEKVESLQTLEKLCNEHPRLSTKISYNDIVTKLRMIVLKDMNVNVVAAALKVLTCLVNGLRAHFDQHVIALAPVLFQKFKEQKEVCNIDKLPAAIDEALKKPNPSVKIQLNLLLYHVFTHYSQGSAPVPFIKAVAAFISASSNEADPKIREAAFGALGSAIRAYGPKAIRALLPTAQFKEDKIEEYVQKAEIDAKEWAAAHNAAGASVSEEPEKGVELSSEGKENRPENAELDPFDLLEPKDISKDLNADFFEKLGSAKWVERKEALESLLTVLEKNPKLSTDLEIYRQLMNEIKKIVEKDSNINVLGLAVKVLAALASGLRGEFTSFIPSVFPPLIAKSKEKKEAFAGPFLNCIDTIGCYIHMQNFSEFILLALNNVNPNTKKQFCLYVSRLFNKLNSRFAPKAQVKELAPKLGSLTADAAPEVRDASYAAIGSIIRCVGDAVAAQLFSDVLSDSLKKSKVEEKTKEFSEKYGDAVEPEMKKIYSASGETARPPQSAPKAAVPRSAASARPSAPRPAPSRTTPTVKREPMVAAKKPSTAPAPNVRPRSTTTPNVVGRPIVSRPIASATTQRSIPANVRPIPSPVQKPMSAQRNARPLGVTPISVVRSASSSRIHPIKPNIVRHSVAPPSTDRPISKPEPIVSNGRASGLPPPRRSVLPVPTSARRPVISRAQSSMTGKSLIS